MSPEPLDVFNDLCAISNQLENIVATTTDVQMRSALCDLVMRLDVIIDAMVDPERRPLLTQEIQP